MMNSKLEALPITIRNVTKTYGQVFALDDVSLDVKRGEFLTLLGPSGSGKTTLLMVLAGFTRPDQGSLIFGNDEVIRKPPHLRNLGMVFQNYALFPHMNVAGNVGYPLRLRKISKAEIQDRVENALDLVQLGGLGDRRIDQISGGQKQRVALARSIVFEPRILLMDEPLSALDKKLRDQMQIELRRLHERLGMTTVYVTHDQREALTMSDRIAVLNHGKIMQLATPQELYGRPQNKFVADFIGESTFLKVEKSGSSMMAGGVKIKTTKPIPKTKNLALLIRPERIRILQGKSDRNVNVFTAVVSNLVYQGESFLLYASLEDGTEVTMRGTMSSDKFSRMLQPGKKVRLGLDASDTLVIADDK
ncbi:MAG: ABC transporter ATP-binding protein [Parvularculales bacterium]